MASFTWDDTTTIHTCLNTATQGTTLNNIAADAIAVSDAGDLDNSSNKDLFIDLQLTCVLDSAPADGDIVATVYVLPEVNDFPTNSTSITPAGRHLAGVFTAQGTATSQIMVVAGVTLWPRDNRFVLMIGDIGFTAADTHYLYAKPYCILST